MKERNEDEFNPFSLRKCVPSLSSLLQGFANIDSSIPITSAKTQILPLVIVNFQLAIGSGNENEKLVFPLI